MAAFGYAAKQSRRRRGSRWRRELSRRPQRVQSAIEAILLAAFAVIGGVRDADRIYGIVFVVVLVSVLGQGTLVPLVDGCSGSRCTSGPRFLGSSRSA
ncbi:MAG: hypothetical protein ABR521_01630 [Gaiellaceae bacterium]